MYIILIGAYLNRYFRPVNRVLVNHASSKSELARENQTHPGDQEDPAQKKTLYGDRQGS